jgi:predicted  nucleic acid-binding Zn-ribbon protein
MTEQEMLQLQKMMEVVVERAVAPIKTDLGEIKERLTDVEYRIATVESKLIDVETEVKIVKTDIKELKFCYHNFSYEMFTAINMLDKQINKKEGNK